MAAAEEPGRVASGDGISAELGCQAPVLRKALETNLMVFAALHIRSASVEPTGCCMQPPDENGTELYR